ncbi:dienelactone hydrolase family protein [Dyella acidiphila]|uniref:Dienelactone hydrolase family protein n=1 Tax=Dyella acidiphila TaxID=2775866 RepID=A0ABR9GA68_9GAMM|nr:tetratricopeptide repeat protein [Dyella acidiphila]MBE1160911.1 dienelactone hydrolase family protein [Dyella acidiphila]
MTIDLAGANTQAGDISYLIGYAQSLPDTDMSKIAVAGYSWGGLAALFAAARDNRIDALVSLDGSLRYFPALVKQSGDVQPEHMALPLLAFTQGEISLEDEQRYFKDASQGPDVLNAWTHGDLITVHMLGLAHVEFSSTNQRNESMWKLVSLKNDYQREDGITGYALMARYTLQFLDAYLKHDASALAYLQQTPAQHGIPAHTITVNFRPAEGAPASIDTYRDALGRQGFAHAVEVYASMQKENPDFKLDETAIDDWAQRLIAEDHVPEAVALLKLNVHNHPDSDSAYRSLGEAYARQGNQSLARASYQHALEKNPHDSDAIQDLKELQSQSSAKK